MYLNKYKSPKEKEGIRAIIEVFARAHIKQGIR